MCEELFDILIALSGCCCCYWWSAIRNEKPPEKRIKRSASESVIKNLNVSDTFNENIIYAKNSNLKYILPIDMSIHDEYKHMSPQKQNSEKFGKGTPKINLKATKTPLCSEKFDKTSESLRQQAVKNSDNFVLLNTTSNN